MKKQQRKNRKKYKKYSLDRRIKIILDKTHNGVFERLREIGNQLICLDFGLKLCMNGLFKFEYLFHEGKSLYFCQNLLLLYFMARRTIRTSFLEKILKIFSLKKYIIKIFFLSSRPSPRGNNKKIIKQLIRHSAKIAGKLWKGTRMNNSICRMRDKKTFLSE